VELEVREDVERDAVLRAVSEQACHMYQAIRSIAVFDGNVRGAAARRGR
jgi:hypothetical protein